MNKIVFDIETQNSFEEAGSPDPAALKVSVVIAYEYATDTYHSFWEHELDRLWPLMERADQIIGFNQDHFDIPVLNQYYRGDLFKLPSLDLMKEVVKSLGRRVSLNAIATATLGAKKSANGLDAIRWWKQGELEKIKKYCIDDVRITKDVYEYALKNKQVKIFNGAQEQVIRLDTSKWEAKPTASVNFTLPF
ncbi:MAG: ribonuclease H-like domain-containing protein [Patescibacteria group bacterium]